MNRRGDRFKAWRRWVLDLDVDVYMKGVLNTLLYYANAEGECWPSVETIARGTGISKRKTQKVINDLVGAGYIEITRSRGRRSNVYQFPENPALGTGLETTNPAREVSQPRTRGVPTPHTVHPNSKELCIERSAPGGNNTSTPEPNLGIREIIEVVEGMRP